MRAFCFIVAFLVGCGSASDGGGSNVVRDGGAPPIFLHAAISGPGRLMSAPAGLACPPACDVAFPAGTVVSIAATADPGFKLDSFGGACSGQSCTVPLSRDATISALFIRAMHPVAVSIRGAGHVRSNPGYLGCPFICSASFDTNSIVTLTATP
jgi:hypothetical protein